MIVFTTQLVFFRVMDDHCQDIDVRHTRAIQASCFIGNLLDFLIWANTGAVPVCGTGVFSGYRSEQERQQMPFLRFLFC